MSFAPFYCVLILALIVQKQWWSKSTNQGSRILHCCALRSKKKKSLFVSLNNALVEAYIQLILSHFDPCMHVILIFCFMKCWIPKCYGCLQDWVANWTSYFFYRYHFYLKERTNWLFMPRYLIFPWKWTKWICHFNEKMYSICCKWCI